MNKRNRKSWSKDWPNYIFFDGDNFLWKGIIDLVADIFGEILWREGEGITVDDTRIPEPINLVEGREFLMSTLHLNTAEQLNLLDHAGRFKVNQRMDYVHLFEHRLLEKCETYVQLMDGVEEFLESLEQKKNDGYELHLYIVSKGSQYQVDLLSERLGIRRYFDTAFGVPWQSRTGQYTKEKIIKEIARSHPEAFVAVGGDSVNDMKTANNIRSMGFNVAAFGSLGGLSGRDELIANGADIVVDSLGETERILGFFEKGQDDNFPLILKNKGYVWLETCTGGGSASRNFLVKNAKGKVVVAKYGFWDGISGNGIPWLMRQHEKYLLIHNSFPEQTRELYPNVLDFGGDMNEFYLVLEHFEESETLPDYLFRTAKLSVDDIEREVSNVLSLLVKTHYSMHLELYFDELKSNYLDRALYRVSLLSANSGEVYERLVRGHEFLLDSLSYPDVAQFFTELKEEYRIIINGRKYLNLPVLVSVMNQRFDDLLNAIGPSHYSKYGHGDIPLRNILRMNTGAMKIIDVRGIKINPTSPSKISVEYDIEKIAHSFLMELTRRNFFELHASKDSDGFKFNLQLKSDPRAQAFYCIWQAYPRIVKSNSEMQSLLCSSLDKLVDRIPFGEGIHYASDAIMRLLQDPSGFHSVVYYLHATMILSQYLLDIGIINQDSVNGLGSTGL